MAPGTKSLESSQAFPEVNYFNIDSEITFDGKYKKSGRTQSWNCLKTLFICCGALLLALCVLTVCGIFLHCKFLVAVEVEDSVSPSSPLAQCDIEENNRFDCWPEKNGASEELCGQRGCCWKPASRPETAPYCFFPSDYVVYKVASLNQTSSGIEATLNNVKTTFFSKDVKTVKLQIEYQTDTRLRIKFTDQDHARYEVPMKVPSDPSSETSRQYSVQVSSDPFNIVVKRVSTGATVFDTTETAPLIFSDQFLQIATRLSTKYLYGLGEHRSSFLQDLTGWKRLVFYNRDDSPRENSNGYGSHPFYLNMEAVNSRSDNKHYGSLYYSRDSASVTTTNAHGVFLLNSDPGEVALQPFGDQETGAITYRMMGGVLDLFIVMGPDPVSVVSQYTDIVGRPYLPPFWSLGFHLCRYGYTSDNMLKEVIDRNRAAQMPYDVQWNDIDYMDGHRDWTYDPYSYKSLPSIVNDLHDHNQRYVIIVDPGIDSEQQAGTYPPFDDGKSMGIFVKAQDGSILIGQVWPGFAAFPDFFHPEAVKYWTKEAESYHSKIPFNGLWIDMNEPSNFVDGSVQGCPYNSLNDPPYLPPTISGGSLYAKTICPSSRHSLSSHYNLHNMYGWSMANVTRGTLNSMFPGNRTLLITRSSFPGAGQFSGHWLGDDHSAFSEMYYTIPGILNFNLFGIPQIGADICGFGGSTTSELCVRWHQLGAFYPFMRNHNNNDSPDQDPAVFDSPYKDYIRSALQLRYKLLAILYNQFFDAHVSGVPIVRPLFFMYPGTETIDTQFMWGDQLLISPVLDEGETSVTAFIPKDTWYDFYTGAALTNVGKDVTLNAPLDHINVHVRGGSILPLLPPTQRTDFSRLEKFELLVASDASSVASGQLFWDDGEDSGSISASRYSHIHFTLFQNELTNKVIKAGYKPSNGIILGSVKVLGVKSAPTKVILNTKSIPFSYDSSNKVLNVTSLSFDLLQSMKLSWE